MLPETDFDGFFFVRPLATQQLLEALWASQAWVQPKGPLLTNLCGRKAAETEFLGAILT